VVVWVMTPCSCVVGYQCFGDLASSIFRVKWVGLDRDSSRGLMGYDTV